MCKTCAMLFAFKTDLESIQTLPFFIHKKDTYLMFKKVIIIKAFSYSVGVTVSFYPQFSDAMQKKTNLSK